MADKNFMKRLTESSVGNILVYVINILFPILAEKLYGFYASGEYTYGLSIVNMTMFVATLGLGTGLLYFIPKEGNKYITFSFVMNFFASLVIILGMFFMFEDTSVRVMLPLIWFMSAEQIFFSIFRAKHSIKEYFRINIMVGLVLKSILIWVFYLLWGANYLNIVIATYISVGISLVIYFIKQRDEFGKLIVSKRVISYSLPLIIGSMMSVLMSQIDIVMIRNMIGSEDVQIYNLVAKIATFPSIFLLVLNTIFPPIVAKLYHDGDMPKLREMYKKSARTLALISGIVIIVMIIFRKQILLLCGAEYLQAEYVLIYRGIGQVINASVGSVWYIICMTGRSKTNMFGKIVAAILNTVLNFVLIPKMGITGAALASMITVGFVNILGYSIVKRILDVKVYGIV
ncbi:flippase [Oceanirhabdus seepicola]|uniref:Flippase n=1 Tax=Oceanirhabdus seepicola TaxID=2828781 RepID=A0A9J6P9N0_9CLOT|nr:flippase [Oceanirhabdus seepicola]MCM1992149.1 flippase [Oceanirhabdus seepicola]